MGYQDVVNGWIEPVEIRPLGSTLYVDEEGPPRRLPFNPARLGACGGCTSP
jgi:hypothetical protein